MIEGKVALISGALGGIGMCYTKELLRHKIKGLALLDINDTAAESFLKELQREFGKVDVIFLKVDVTITSQIKDAYDKTVNHFNQLDLVINNVGILNEIDAEKTITTNLTSVAVSTNLAMNIYLQKYRSGEEAIIVNTASISGLFPCFIVAPFYSMTKSGIITLGRCLGADEMFQLKKVKILTVCPGMTQTPLVYGGGIVPELINSKADQEIQKIYIQSPEHVARCVMEIIAKGKTGSVWSITGEKPADEIDYSSVDATFLSYITNSV